MNKKFHPILFSTPMVQAIMKGRKTQTRRVVKSRHESGLFQICRQSDNQIVSIKSLDWDERNCEKDVICPYGKVGDILWVRETWRKNEIPTGWPYHFYADDDYANKDNEKWKPSIFMPKEACRLFLEITDIRVERLQEISPVDACDEGIEYCNVDADAFEGGELQADFKNYTWKDDESYEDYHFPTFASCIASFRTLWQKINGEESWNNNPWVWVISFKRVERPENF